MTKRICAWLLLSNLQRFFYLLQDVKQITLTTPEMIVQTFCSIINSAADVKTDTEVHVDIYKWKETEKRRIQLHPFHMKPEKRWKSNMAFDVHK